MTRLVLVGLTASIIILMVAAGAVVLLEMTSADVVETVGYGEVVRLDDFAFAALESERVPQIGDLRANGIFYVVTFRVMNRARRVSFQFRPDSAVLVDGLGAQYTPSPLARQAWFTTEAQTDPCEAELPAGTECTTTLVFEVPAGTQAPTLRMEFGGRIGEIVDAVLIGSRVIQLK